MKDNSTAQLRERVRDFIYDATKDEFQTGWTLSAHQTDDIIAMVRADTRAPVSQDAEQLVERLRAYRSHWANRMGDVSVLDEAIEALTRPQPSTSSVEAVLHKLIDAARMYEASCRLGGKDQEFASLKLDEAKSAALAVLPSPEREPMREALAGARAVLWRYRHETPLGHQPHMIAHVADVAIADADAVLAPPTAQSGDRT